MTHALLQESVITVFGAMTGSLLLNESALCSARWLVHNCCINYQCVRLMTG